MVGSAIEPVVRLVGPEVKILAVLRHFSELMFGEALKVLSLLGCRRRFHLEPGLVKGCLDIGVCYVACLGRTGRDEHE